MKRITAVLGMVLTLVVVARADTPGPQVDCAGPAGPHTYLYWQVPDLGPQAAPGRPSQVTRLENVAELTGENTASITPAPVDGARRYMILRSVELTAPKPMVTVNRKGDGTFYYWLVVRHGWFFTAPSEPVEARGCDTERPDNTVSWDAPPGGPYGYDIYRTPTRHLPLGRCASSAAYNFKGTEFHDTHSLLGFTRIFLEGNEGTAPFGTGNYLLDATTEAAVVDRGQPLKHITLLGGDHEGKEAREFVVDNPPQEVGDRGHLHRAFTIKSIHREPTDRYSFGSQTALNIVQHALTGGLNDRYKQGWYPSSPSAKTFYTGILSEQLCHTHAQHIARFTTMEGYACGDKALEVAVINTYAGNRDGGDEGSEFFSYQVQRHLKTANFVLKSAASRGATQLELDRDNPAGGLSIAQIGTGRILLNMSRTYSEGHISRIDNDIQVNPGSKTLRVCVVHGHGTDWKPEMVGGFISLDTDTVDSDKRMWYLVHRVVSATELQISAITYYAAPIYKGYAQNVVEHGLEYRGGDKSAAKPDGWRDVSIRRDGMILEPYQFAPGTEVDNPVWSDRRLQVLPLSIAWSAGDKLRIVPGPQATLGVGNFLFHGKLLPQDGLKGITLMNFTSRMADGAGVWALGKGWRWGFRTDLADNGESCGFYVGGQTARPDEGCFSMPSDTAGVVFRDAPVTLAGNADEKRVEFTTAWTSDKPGTAVFSVSPTAIRAHDGAVWQGNANTRGKVALSGDGRTKAFTIEFPAPYAAEPIVTFSTDDFTPSRLKSSAADAFIVEFAEALPKGKTVTLSWIAQL